jgi:hypothetical protein
VLLTTILKIICRILFRFHQFNITLLCRNTCRCFVILLNKIGKVYSLEYTDIPKVFFTPHHVGHCSTKTIRCNCCTLGYSCTYVIRSQCCSLGHSCTNAIRCNRCATMVSLPTVERQRPPVMRVAHLVDKTRQSDMEGSIRCSSLKLEREEHLKRFTVQNDTGLLHKIWISLGSRTSI